MSSEELLESEPQIAAESARRRRVVLGVSGAFALVSLLAVAHGIAVGSRPAIIGTNFLAALGLAITCAIAYRRRHTPPTHAAVAILLIVQLQHVCTAMNVPRAADIGTIFMFSGLLPLIAGETLRVRGALITSVAATCAVLFVFAASFARGFELQSLSRYMGASLFFILVAGVVATLSAVARQRALQEQVQRAHETRRAEAEARAERERFRAIADQVSDLVSVLDQEGHYTFVSASFERILGVNPEDLVGTIPWELIHPDDIEDARKAFAKALRKETTEVVLRVRAEDEELRTLHVRLMGVEVDQRPHVAVAARDITELQTLTEELESVRRMDALGRLAGGVAHDFNNLLSVIASCASMAQARLPKDHAAQRELGMVDDAVERAARLTSSLLAFARRQVLPKGHVTPGRSVERLAPLLERAVASTITLRVDSESSVWSAEVGEAQLEQVVMNLVVNAKDAMPDGGMIDIRVRDRTLDPEATPQATLAPGDYIEVEVRDTGTGISPALQARVFEPFFTTKTERRGTGLGLASCFGIARQAGGDLTVESEPGCGTRFRLLLPKASTTEERANVASKSVSQPPSLPHQPGRRVLVIDDQPHICNVVIDLLRSEGMQGDAATHMSEALEKASRLHYDIILTDVVLGREDGLDVIEQLRAVQPDAHLVVMSGYAPFPERLAALRETGIGFLAKPFPLKALLDVVRGRAD